MVRAVSQARAAVNLAGMAEVDALDTGESIARQDLMLITGRSRDIARLDPEKHNR